MLEKLKSRKFLFTAYVMVLAPILLWFGKLDGTSFMALMGLAQTVFIAGESYVDSKAVGLVKP
jgi:hypothetical protein